MRIVNLILTYLFAAVFLILGVGNYFFHFMATPPPPNENAGNFGMIVYNTGFMLAVKVIEFLAGIMIAFNIRRALGWALILPVVVCIALFEVLISKTPRICLVLLAINLYMILYGHRDKFKALWELHLLTRIKKHRRLPVLFRFYSWLQIHRF